jgi:hypothetical protein
MPVVGTIRQTSNLLTLRNVRNARTALQTRGHLLIQDCYTQDSCNSIVEFVDRCDNDATAERNYNGTELRIWGAQAKDALLASFFEECNLFASCLLGHDTEASTLLAIRNRSLDAHDQASVRGRWHIDSLRPQVKIFLFLTDTTEDSGPFEFIPGTHTWSFKLRTLFDGVYLRPSDLFTDKRPYQHLDDAWVDGLSAKGYRSVPVLCKAGTVLVVDTSAIHRARPCLNGARYALTAYFYR